MHNLITFSIVFTNKNEGNRLKLEFKTTPSKLRLKGLFNGFTWGSMELLNKVFYFFKIPVAIMVDFNSLRITLFSVPKGPERGDGFHPLPPPSILLKISRQNTVYAPQASKFDIFQKCQSQNIYLEYFTKVPSEMNFLSYFDNQQFICKKKYFTGVPKIKKK